MYLGYEFEFSYIHHTTFAPNTASLKHITHLIVFLDPELHGVLGFQIHFDDRAPFPDKASCGKPVTLLIDGVAGERIEVVNTFWCEKAQCASLTVSTLHDPLT